ncbi:MAG TPA: hypothetical protein VKK79_26380, partial [Candidatus Lokiarchaeia archaeon]|nr:hypothetical protein [Candidatus Lokiarchaeia archaeon]
LNWTYAPFLASGQSFVVSRDFPFAIYDVDLPVAGLATLTTVYGPCTISYAPVEFIPAPLTNCWYAHTVPIEGYPVMYATPNGASFTGGFHAYLIVLGSYVAPHGSVLQLTITATIDWLSWGIAIAALVALVIVAIVLSRKK